MAVSSTDGSCDLKAEKQEACSGKDAKTKKETDATVLPHQDHGYAWVIVFATFVYNVVLGGTYKAFGVIYIGLMDLHGAGAFKTSLVNVVYSLCTCLGSLVTGWLCDRFPLRTIVLVGTIVSVAGIAMASFATNIYVVIVGYGILAGLGSACFDSPLFCAMAQYWNKKKTLANGIAYSGTSLGTLVFPLIYTILIEQYTVRGALLLAGGFWLHIAISGMLLKPPPEYKSKQKKQPPADLCLNETVLCVKELEKSDTNVNLSIPNDTFVGAGAVNRAFIIDETLEYTSSVKTKLDPSKFDLTEETISDISSVVEKQESQAKLPLEGQITPSTKDLGYRDILTNMAFVRHLVMTSLSACAAMSILFIIPSLAVEWGASDVTASLTVTVSGATELVSRMSMGYFIDRFHINKVRLWSAASVLMGLCGVAVAYTGQVTAVILLGAMLGMCGTIVTPLLVPVMSDCIPFPLLGRASGLLLFTFGVGPAVGYAVAGQLKEMTGSTVDSLVLFSFMFFFVSAVGLTDVINSITRRLFKKLFTTKRSKEPNLGTDCDIKEQCHSDKEESHCNSSQDFISTWL